MGIAAILLAGMGLAAGAWTAIALSRDLAAARRRLAGRSIVIATPDGPLEYAVVGEGPPIMMLHGAGGGFDQGLRFSERLIRRGHPIIAPSRFGYLRSGFPADASPARQADALVALLDHLGIARLPVAGGSAGALAAAQFALRHPDRCSGLILLVPAANVLGSDPVTMGPIRKRAIETALSSDFLIWALARTSPNTLIGSLLATDPALLKEAVPGERARALAIVNDLLPVSARSRGLMNDALRSGEPADVDFAGIERPTLILSLDDDRFGTAATARHLAGVIPGARLVIYPSGGHIWLGHDADVMDEIAGFLAAISA